MKPKRGKEKAPNEQKNIYGISFGELITHVLSSAIAAWDAEQDYCFCFMHSQQGIVELHLDLDEGDLQHNKSVETAKKAILKLAEEYRAAGIVVCFFTELYGEEDTKNGILLSVKHRGLKPFEYTRLFVCEAGGFREVNPARFTIDAITADLWVGRA